jgi:wyosine [tRNA(Phe)-imidazoG37] synthetase (radical SAM superfamily)
MLCLGYNDDFVAIESFKELLGRIRYDKLYLNSPIRPPAIETVKPLEQIDMERIAQDLKGISIDVLAKPNFYSAIKDDYLALRSIISRHPMNQYEIECFLKTRHNCKIDDVFSKLENDLKIDKIDYKGFITYRFKVGENYEV